MNTYAQRWREWVESTDEIMYGTEAHHQLGDISRPVGDFFRIEREDDDCYVGRWLTGFGFVGVRFPKHTTRTISSYERRWLADHPVRIS